MPSASTCEMAGRPSTVAGILMRTLSRSTAAASSLAWSTVLPVSWASRGSTSIDTRPSTTVGRVVDRLEDVAGVADVLGRQAEHGLVDGLAVGRELAQVGVVAVTLGQRGLEDRRVGGHAHDTLGVDELLEVAGLDALARQVVEPDGDAVVGEGLEGCVVSHGSVTFP